jgi:hypothetical protein
MAKLRAVRFFSWLVDTDKCKAHHAANPENRFEPAAKTIAEDILVRYRIALAH